MNNFLHPVGDFFTHLLRRILQIVLHAIIGFICVLIYVVAYEPGKKHKATARKAKRIKVLTKVKLYTYKYFQPLCDFLHNTYLKNLYNKFHFLIEK